MLCCWRDFVYIHEMFIDRLCLCLCLPVTLPILVMNAEVQCDSGTCDEGVLHYLTEGAC
jgi:hypothetical protein